MTRNVLSITLEVPFEGITDAGGEFVRRHYHVLGDTGELRVLARDTPENRHALERVDPPGLPVFLLESDWRSARVLRPARALRNLLAGFALGAEFAGPLMANLRRMDLSDVDIIEFQWTEGAQWAKGVRRLAPRARLILVAHDVVSQRRARAHEHARGIWQRAYTSIRTRTTRRSERRVFESVDTVIVFSEKDAELVRSIAPGASVAAIATWLTPQAEEVEAKGFVPATRDRGVDPVVLFTGAMARTENDDAAVWLTTEIWPLVREQVPNAKLVIAGARPTARLQALAAMDESVEVTGFVEDMEAMYRLADVFISPLRLGAGVKFKTISAMLAGLPVVSTTAGAEGIGTAEDYVVVTDSARELANGVADACSNIPLWSARAQELQKRVYEVNGRQAYQQAICQIFSATASKSRSSPRGGSRSTIKIGPPGA